MIGYPHGGWQEPSAGHGIQQKPVTIQSGMEGVEPRQGHMGVCPCQCDKWLIWQIKGHQSPHLQCANCGAVFCLGLDCKHEAAEDSALLQEGGGS